MDGIPPPPSPLPTGGTAIASPAAPPSPVPQTYGFQNQPQNNAPQPNAVGRPSKDQDQNEARAKDRVAIEKFMKTLPKEATDHRVSVYRLKGRRGSKMDNRAVAKVLLSELEEAAANGVDAADYIEQALQERYGDDQPIRFMCVPQDSHGKRLTTLASWEVAINWDDDEEMEEEYEEVHEMPNFMDSMPPHMTTNQATLPPAHTMGGEDSALREAKQLLSNQRESEQSHTAMMMAMMQQQQQQQQASSQMMMQMMMQQQQDRERQAEQRREEERRYQEERRREEERRSEERQREEQRRVESRTQLMATLIPTAMPLVQKMMEGKEDKLTPLLLTKIFDGQNNQSSAHDMMTSMMTASGEMQRQQLQTQGEMMRQTMAQQSENSQSMINHVLSMAQKSVEAQQQLDSTKEEGPMDTFLNVVQGIAPLLSQAQASNPAAIPQMPAQQVPVPQAPPIVPQQAQQAPPPQQSPPAQKPNSPPTRETNPEITDDQWIKGSIQAIKRLHTGSLPDEQRPSVLRWVQDVLPMSVMQDIQSGDHDAVMQACSPAVMSDPDLIQWITETEGSQDFLMQCIEELATVETAPQTQVPVTEPPAERPSKIPPPPIEDTAESEIIHEENEDFPATNGIPTDTEDEEPEETEEVDDDDSL